MSGAPGPCYTTIFNLPKNLRRPQSVAELMHQLRKNSLQKGTAGTVRSGPVVQSATEQIAGLVVLSVAVLVAKSVAGLVALSVTELVVFSIVGMVAQSLQPVAGLVVLCSGGLVTRSVMGLVAQSVAKLMVQSRAGLVQLVMTSISENILRAQGRKYCSWISSTTP